MSELFTLDPLLDDAAPVSREHPPHLAVAMPSPNDPRVTRLIRASSEAT